MHNYIVFNGKNSVNNFGLVIDQQPESAHASKRGDLYQVAGRNGTFVREDGVFDNYEQVYDINFIGNAYSKGRDVATWLLGSSGYCRLEDSYESDYYRLARYAGPLNIESILLHCGRGSIVFDCQPQRYLKTGETAVTLFQNVNIASIVTQSATISNATSFQAKPLIKITGRGQIRIMSEGPDPGTEITDITLDLGAGSSDVNFDIDCDSYAMSIPSAITYHTTYPVLTTLFPGTNTISLTNVGLTNPGYVTKLEIVPRWWTI